MKKYKIIAFTSIIITLAVVIGIFGVSAQSTEVSNVDEFITAIDNGGKIKLVSDIDLGEFTGKRVTVAAGTEVEIDLNGYTISGIATDEKISSALIQNNGSLVIHDNSETKTGKITLSDNNIRLNTFSKGIFTINNEGTLEINSGTIENTGGTDVPYAIDNNTTSRNATVTINGGTIVANRAAIRAFCNSTKNENKIIINDGNITAGSSAIWISQVSAKANKGYLEVNGGNIYGRNYNGIYVSVFEQSLMSEISVKISGGTIKNNSETAASFTYEYWNSPDELANAVLNLDITGGIFINENENGRAFYNPDFLEIPVTYTNITGGSYTTDISEYIKDGYASRLIGDLYVVGTEYDINVSETTNGTVIVDKSKAISNETVTLTVKPNEEYELVSLKVMDSENNIIEAINNSFAMPTSNVTVTAEFKKIKYAINTNGLTNGEFTVDKQEASKGETITVTVTPDEEYELDKIVVVDINNKEITVTDNKFTMPSGEVTVSVQLKQIEYNVLVEEVTNGIIEVDKTKATKGETITISTTPKEGYKISSIKVIDTNDNEVTITDGAFTMPSGDVTIIVTFTKIEYAINVDELENGTISIDKEVATMGDIVTITATPNAGYELVSVKVVDSKNNEIKLTDNKFTMPNSEVTVTVELADIRHAVNIDKLENGTVTVDKAEADRGDIVTITVTPDAGYELVSVKVIDAENNEVTLTDNKFTMPNSEVTVTVSLADIRHTVRLDALANGTVTVDKAEADRGDIVTITVTPDEGYELVSVKVVDAENNEVTLTDNKFTMPNSEVTVTVELADIRHAVNIDKLENGTVTVDKAEADRGDTVTVTVNPNAEYKLVSVKVVDSKNNEVTLTNNKFTMPNSEVTVTVILEQIKYAVNITQPTNGRVEVDKEEAAKGETVTITAIIPSDGYELSSIKVVDKDNKALALTNDSFIMPAGEVTVSVELSKISYTTEVKPLDPTQKVEEVEVGVKESEELNNVLLDSLNELLKDEEKQELASIVGTTSTKVEVEISKLEEETIEEETIEAMQEKAGNAKIATFFDINVLIKHTKEDAVLGTIDTLTKEIELMILLPEELKNTDKKVDRNYFIVRKHGTRIDTIPATLSEDGNHLVFKSKEFSTYALAYEDKANTPNPNTYDGIGIYFAISSLSLITLAGIVVLTKQKKLFN